MRKARTPVWHLALLCGGDSTEREVSLRSGAEMAKALRTAGHSVEPFDPAEVRLEQITWRAFDACVLALHGGAGEDGRVQQWLADRHVPYTGSGPAASKTAMSKWAAKEAFQRAGVATPAATAVHPDDSKAVIDGKVARLGYPVVVKPDGQGSSLGVQVVRHPEPLMQSVAQARQFDAMVLAERFVPGRELTVAVLGRRPLPVLEIVGRHEVFDYQSKYNSPATEYRFDTGLAPMKTEEIQQAAVAAAAALGTSGLVRVDLMLDAQQRPWILEINTLPGMTERSLAPRAAAEAGLDMPALCEWMVRDALERHAAAGRRPVEPDRRAA